MRFLSSDAMIYPTYFKEDWDQVIPASMQTDSLPYAAWVDWSYSNSSYDISFTPKKSYALVVAINDSNEDFKLEIKPQNIENPAWNENSKYFKRILRQDLEVYTWSGDFQWFDIILYQFRIAILKAFTKNVTSEELMKRMYQQIVANPQSTAFSQILVAMVKLNNQLVNESSVRDYLFIETVSADRVKEIRKILRSSFEQLFLECLFNFKTEMTPLVGADILETNVRSVQFPSASIQAGRKLRSKRSKRSKKISLRSRRKN